MRRRHWIGAALLIAAIGVVGLFSCRSSHGDPKDVELRRQRLHEIAVALQGIVDDRDDGRWTAGQDVDAVLASHPELLAPLELPDGSTIRYQLVEARLSASKSDLFATPLVREVVVPGCLPKGTLYSDGHVEFDDGVECTDR